MDSIFELIAVILCFSVVIVFLNNLPSKKIVDYIVHDNVAIYNVENISDNNIYLKNGDVCIYDNFTIHYK